MVFLRSLSNKIITIFLKYAILIKHWFGWMVVFISSELKKQILFFIGVFGILFVLWLPGLKNPIDFDTLHYSILTENLIA